MTRKDIYKIWAPYGKKWVDWVRPVPFINIDETKEFHDFINYHLPIINYSHYLNPDTAIIVDIPGTESIQEGISLAKLGYRPIPVFNGTNPQAGTITTTNNEFIEPLLIWGALELQNINIKDDAPPAFLLDTNRLNRYKSHISLFDNSWDIYHQDLPSPNYFLQNNITKIIVRSDKLQKDLGKILYKHQQNNIQILLTNGYENPKEIKIKKPKTKDI